MGNNKAKKRGGCLSVLLILILILVIIVVGVVFFFRMQRPEAVTYDQEDVAAFYEKMSVEPGAYTFGLIDFMNGDVVATGIKPVDAVFTSAEITGGIQSSTSTTRASIGPSFLGFVVMDVYAAEDISGVKDYNTGTIFGDINVRFTGPDQIEVFAIPTEGFRIIYDYAPELANYSMAVDRIIGATVFAKMTLTYSNETLNLDITEVTIDGIPVPINLIDPYEGDVSRQLSWALKQVEGLVIEEMTIQADAFRFKVTVPESIRRITE